MNPFAILSSATRRWWDEWISAILVSVFWLLAQLLVIPGPPATAALFAMARRSHDGEYWGAPDVWAAFKELFVPAWLWALPNIAVIGLAIYNISTFWALPHGAWSALRVVWVVGLIVWLGLNLFYWPFLLAAEDKSLRNTYVNCARFWLLHPLAAVVLFLVCLIVGLITLPFALAIVLGSIFWITLVSEMTVRNSLKIVLAR